MLGENGGSTAVAQEQNTERMSPERLIGTCILTGSMYEVRDRSHSSPHCCGGLLREGKSIYRRSQVPPGESHHAAGRIVGVRIRTVTS